MSTQIAKQHDSGYVFDDDMTILDDAGAPVPLEECTVWFVMARSGALPTIAAEATIVDVDAQTVRYVTVAADFATAGVFQQVWLCEFDDGRRYTSPSRGHNTVWVQANPAGEVPDDGS